MKERYESNARVWHFGKWYRRTVFTDPSGFLVAEVRSNTWIVSRRDDGNWETVGEFI